MPIAPSSLARLARVVRHCVPEMRRVEIDPHLLHLESARLLFELADPAMTDQYPQQTAEMTEWPTYVLS
jgi:DNA-binding protein YbaB